MSRSKSTASADRQNSGHTRKLSHRGLPFIGLLLMDPLAFVIGLLTNFALPSPIGKALATGGIVAGTALLAHLAFGLGGRRQAIVRWHVTVTVILTGLAEALTVAIGFYLWWATTFLLSGLFVAASWGLYRIDALRQRPDQGEMEPDPLTKKLGLEETGFGKPRHFVDAKGHVTRTEVPVRHGPGETVEVIQGAVAGIESAAGAPRGRSRAVPSPDNAGKSNLVIIRKDVLASTIPWPGPSAPGVCITAEPLISAVYEDQQPVRKFLAGGHPDAANPSSYGYMGMTRTGKTLNAQMCALEMFTRKHVVIFWFDTIKGAQTVAPMRDGLDIAVSSDDPNKFKAGMRALSALVKWRAQRLGECGYRAWTAKAAEDPRLKMPLVVAHFEEADALCDVAPSEMVFLASKGLSAGVVVGVSLQRADANSMPTGLRFNIGTWSVFGCGDEYSAGFALSDATIAAGAHPENWKQAKPGYHYLEGVGVPEERWPVTARSYFAEDDEMREHTQIWAPHMDPLDAGSIRALGNWYATTKAEMAADDSAALNGRASAVSSTNNDPAAGFDPDDMDPDDAELAAVRQDVLEEMSAMREDGTIPAQLDEEAEAIDPTVPVPPPPADDEPELSWGQSKDAAPTAEAAAQAFDRALREIAEDEALRDPDDPAAVLFSVGTLLDRYQFRSRPWFSERLSDAADGKLVIPPGLVLSRTEKAGHYRMERHANLVTIGHAQ